MATVIAGTAFGNPYQLGMVTVMGAFNGVNHTHVATGHDSRTLLGGGKLVLVSPIRIEFGPLGNLVGLATLTVSFAVIPEPGGFLLLAAGAVGLATLDRRRRRGS